MCALWLVHRVQMHPDVENWTDSSFLDFLSSDVGKGVGWLATAASMACNIGTFQSGLSSSACAVWALAGGDKTSIMPCRHIPGIFGYTWKRAYHCSLCHWFFTRGVC